MTVKKGYTVEVKPSHADWGQYRNPTNRKFIANESYVKIPADAAREFNVKRENQYNAYFEDGSAPIRIKASGNGPVFNGVQLAKQFEGVGRGACKAFTPWYKEHNIQPGDYISIEFINDEDIMFRKV